jgi:hypothetical protein
MTRNIAADIGIIDPKAEVAVKAQPPTSFVLRLLWRGVKKAHEKKLLKYMAKKSTAKDYLLLFRGGANPEDLSPEQMKQVMNNWFSWIGQLRKRGQYKLGSPLEDGGKLLSGKKGQKVRAFTESEEAVGGYLIIQASSLAQAAKIAKGCPIFDNGGTVEVRPIHNMPGM